MVSHCIRMIQAIVSVGLFGLSMRCCSFAFHINSSLQTHNHYFQRHYSGLSANDEDYLERDLASSPLSDNSNSDESPVLHNQTCLLETKTPSLKYLEKNVSQLLNIPILSDQEVIDNSNVKQCITIQDYKPSKNHEVSTYSLGIISIPFHEQKKARYKSLKKSNPLIVDFSSASNLGRRIHSKNKSEMLLKCIGQKDKNLVVYDLTAGFGRDSAILASSPAVKSVVISCSFLNTVTCQKSFCCRSDMKKITYYAN